MQRHLNRNGPLLSQFCNFVTFSSRYLRTWFWLDFISSLPLDYVLNAATGHTDGLAVKGASRALKFLRLAKLLSLLKLLRVSRILRYMSQYEEVGPVSQILYLFHESFCLDKSN